MIISFIMMPRCSPFLFFFFFNDTATTEIYTLSLHDALPICQPAFDRFENVVAPFGSLETLRHRAQASQLFRGRCRRSEEHTSELQSRQYLVCRLLLEKKKKFESAEFLDIDDRFTASTDQACL